VKLGYLHAIYAKNYLLLMQVRKMEMSSEIRIPQLKKHVRFCTIALKNLHKYVTARERYISKEAL